MKKRTREKPYTILVVEDDETIRWSLVQTLRGTGYEVLEADCGNAALKLLASKTVDLVLSDIQMPNGDGFYLLESMRQGLTPPAPLAFVSGHPGITPSEVKARGALTLFHKPFVSDHLLEWIRAYLATIVREHKS